MPEGTPLRASDPTQLGPYRLTARLGMGGQGIVFLAVGPTDEQVAVKVLREEWAAEEDVRTRFAREVTAARRVAPFCIAQVLDADLTAARPYIVSEYINGPSLQQAVRGDGPGSGAELYRLAVATATALAAIHAAGVVHRDFKPGNVLIGPDGPRVIDFGIARALEGSTATLTKGVVGTPAYMAPEQIRGERVGPSADVFAWGCVIAYATTGRAAFGGDSVPAVAHRILSAPPDLGELGPPLRELVEACLTKDPAGRPSAEDLLLRLLGRGTSSVGQTTDVLAQGQHAAETREITAALAMGAAAHVATAPMGGGPAASDPTRRHPGPSRGRRRAVVLTGLLLALVGLGVAAGLLLPGILADHKKATPAGAGSAPGATSPGATTATTAPPGKFVGSWFGVGFQSNVSRWPVRMVVQPSGAGTIEYPGMRCSGVLRRLSTYATGWRMRYDINNDPDQRCLAKAEFTIEQPTADELVYTLFRWQADEVLAKVRMSREPATGPLRVPPNFAGTWTGGNDAGQNVKIELTGGAPGGAGRVDFGAGCGGVLTPTSADGQKLSLALVVTKGTQCHRNEDVRLELTSADALTLTHLDRFGKEIGHGQLRRQA